MMLKFYKNNSPILLFTIAILFTLSVSGCIQIKSNQNRESKEKTNAAATATTTATAAQILTPTSLPATSTPTVTAEPVSMLGVEPEDLRGATIQFWHTWGGEAGQILNERVDAFNAENEWGIQVEAAYRGNLDEMSENVILGIAEGDPPDIATAYLYQALEWDSSWELVDLSQYVNDPIWGFTPEEQEDFYSAFWAHDLSGERRIGIPFQRSGQLLYYNASWAEDLGFTELPGTPQEFKRQACAAARAIQQDDNPENDGSGGLILSTRYAAMLGWMSSFGADVTRPAGNEQGESGYNFGSPQVEESFTFLRELYDDGCAWMSENSFTENEFADRLGLFSIASVLDIPYQETAFDQAGNNDHWTILPFPSEGGTPAINVHGPSLEVFSSTPEEQLAAWLFVKWLVSPQNQAELIEVTNAFPIRRSVIDHLQFEMMPKHWTVALDLLELAQPEPPFKSWGIVRWAVSDAATQLFRYYFTIDRVPDLVSFLDQTANDLHRDPLQDSSIITPTATTTIPALEGSPTVAPEKTATPGP